MRCVLRALPTSVAAVLALALSAQAVDIGQPAPGFEGINVDGEKLALDDLQTSEVIVVAFTSNDCPIAVAYEDRFIEFAEAYRDQGVALVAINVNADEDLAMMRQRAEEKRFTFPYVRDESGQSARHYGALVTPHLFVLDRDRRVAYIGSFDDDASRPARAYVVDAVRSLLRGETPGVQKTRHFGCAIRLKR